MVAEVVEVVPLLMGSTCLRFRWGMEMGSDPASCFAFDPGESYFTIRTRFLPIRLFPDMIRALNGKETGGRRPVADPDFVCIHSDPRGNGKPRGSRCGDLGRRCRCCVLDVAVGGAWGLHSVCGGGFSAASL